MRIAAVGDIHATEGLAGTFPDMFGRLRDDADVLLLAGDISNMGRPGETAAFLDAVADAGIPVFTVLGNHDYQSDLSEEIIRAVRDRDITLLDGTAAVVSVGTRTLGVVGTKGFCGGFPPNIIRAFGEPALKTFIRETMHEAKKLENALRNLHADVRVALLHYAPIRETLGEEPPDLHAFLGSSLLCEPLERANVAAVFHGHAHLGAPFGRTATGIPVYNVAMPVIRRPYIVVTL